MRMLLVGAFIAMALFRPLPAVAAESQSFKKFRAAVFLYNRKIKREAGVAFYRSVRQAKVNAALIVPTPYWLRGPAGLKRQNLRFLHRLWRRTGNPCPCIIGVAVPGGKGPIMMVIDDKRGIRIVTR